MHVQRNIKARSFNHYWCVKVISITYSEFVFVVFGIQHAMHMPRIVTCGLLSSTVFSPHYIINGTIFEKKIYIYIYIYIYIEHKMCVLISSTTFV